MAKKIFILTYWILVSAALALTAFSFLIIIFFIASLVGAFLGFVELFFAAMMFIFFVPASSILAMIFSLIAWRIAPKRSCCLSALSAKATLVLSIAPLTVAIGIVIATIALGLVVCLFPGLENTYVKSLQPKNQTELYGIYNADYGLAKEKLILRADLTYIQEVTSKDYATPQVKRGTWRYNYADGALSLDGDYLDIPEKHRQEIFPDNNWPIPDLYPPVRKFLVRKILGYVFIDYIDYFSYRKKRGSEKDPAVTVTQNLNELKTDRESNLKEYSIPFQ